MQLFILKTFCKNQTVKTSTRKHFQSSFNRGNCSYWTFCFRRRRLLSFLLCVCAFVCVRELSMYIQLNSLYIYSYISTK